MGRDFARAQRNQVGQRQQAPLSATSTARAKSTSDLILTLQRTVGNRAVGAILQHQAAQEQAGLAASKADLSFAREVIRSPGRPLDPGARDVMGRRFEYDFSKVRVHADQEAADSAEAIGALAYTVGSHVVFGRGSYEPHLEGGRRLLAHELAHVIQQDTEGEPAGTLKMARHLDPSEVEAEQAAGAVSTGGRTVALHAAHGLLQRQVGGTQGTLERGSAAGSISEPPAQDRWPFSGLPVPPEIAANYIDDRTTAVAVKLALGAVFLTVEGGAEVELPLAEFLEVSYNIVPVFPAAGTKEEARALLPEAEMRRRGLTVCAFYRDPTGVVLPTVLNEQTLPRVMPTFRRALEAERAGAVSAEKTATDLLLWYIGARFPVRIKESNVGAPSEVRGRFFQKPTVTGDPRLPAGQGFTTKFGDITYSTQGSATDVALVRHHEQVHSWLSPRFSLLRNFRADLAMAAYRRSSLLRFLEEALAETYAQLRVHGLRGLPTGITFPVTNGYVTVSAVVTEAAIGTIVVGGTTYGVYVVADRVANEPAATATPDAGAGESPAR
jgi:hypothetical protein